MSLREPSLVLTNGWDLISDRQNEELIIKNDLSTSDAQDQWSLLEEGGENRVNCNAQQRDAESWSAVTVLGVMLLGTAGRNQEFSFHKANKKGRSYRKSNLKNKV